MLSAAVSLSDTVPDHNARGLFPRTRRLVSVSRTSDQTTLFHSGFRPAHQDRALCPFLDASASTTLKAEFQQLVKSETTSLSQRFLTSPHGAAKCCRSAAKRSA